ncbi:probable methyltransferase PMT2 [Oryza brachyantha]|uniref:probable methyltransferase PMT2 n=1 Tax=Oryza brachyantha TaxID=4533 RepID=UPI001ADB6680|nr:probable methyltransferase PMT2 [Oryza brachyantha]
MAIKSVGSGGRSPLGMVVAVGLCCFFYVLGAWQRSGYGKGDSIAMAVNRQTAAACGGGDGVAAVGLSFETHHGGGGGGGDNETGAGARAAPEFAACAAALADHTPCHDQERAMKFPRKDMVYRERHCPPDGKRLRCLVPAPPGYRTPFPWPRSRDYVPFANAPYKSLTVEKAVQNWVQYEGNVFRFPGGGTQFPHGADKYIDQLASVVPFNDGSVRTVLDTGCGVASLGAYLDARGVIAMSFAPRDSHEAQVQFALERGVPAFIGVLGSVKLPFPPRSFDMAHCSRCLIPWSGNGGMYMMEIDRVLRPGGYWVLSGPPINWKANHKKWERTEADLAAEQQRIEEYAQMLCWEKLAEIHEIAIWRKRPDAAAAPACPARPADVRTCDAAANPDDVWYKNMETCITPAAAAAAPGAGELQPFPARLNAAVPPRVAAGEVPGLTAESYAEENRRWEKHVSAYKKVNRRLDGDRYRNIMDMNAGVGGFAAAVFSRKSWVMNVVPTVAELSTLGVVYERGLIGIYHDWCEAFSTYPRTYDLIHGDGVFTLYKDKCKMEDILLEMDRILRPEGTVILRDDVEVLLKVQRIAGGMRWRTMMANHEDSPRIPEKVLYAVKRYWTAGDEGSSSSSEPEPEKKTVGSSSEEKSSEEEEEKAASSSEEKGSEE